MDPRDLDDFMRRSVDRFADISRRLDELERMEIFHPIRHGSMYGDDISQTVTISSIGVYYPVPAGLSDGGSYGFTFQNSRELLTIKAGIYAVVYSLSIECGAANQYVEAAVMVNSTAMLNTVSAAELPTANRLQDIGGNGIIELDEDDLILLSVDNETSTNNLTVDHLNLTIFRVG